MVVFLQQYQWISLLITNVKVDLFKIRKKKLFNLNSSTLTFYWKRLLQFWKRCIFWIGWCCLSGYYHVVLVCLVRSNFKHHLGWMSFHGTIIGSFYGINWKPPDNSNFQVCLLIKFVSTVNLDYSMAIIKCNWI